MSLKCPICGSDYDHDSKICLICESKSINSGLISNDKIVSQKWNCGIFLECESVAFGKRKQDEPYYKIASEPKYYNCKPREEYPWNCNSRFMIKTSITLESGISELGNQELTAEDSIASEKDQKLPLIYE
jgi:hypothetical protein